MDGENNGKPFLKMDPFFWGKKPNLDRNIHLYNCFSLWEWWVASQSFVGSDNDKPGGGLPFTKAAYQHCSCRDRTGPLEFEERRQVWIYWDWWPNFHTQFGWDSTMWGVTESGSWHTWHFLFVSGWFKVSVSSCHGLHEIGAILLRNLQQDASPRPVQHIRVLDDPIVRGKRFTVQCKAPKESLGINKHVICC